MEWEDGKVRCHWANPKNETYLHYHDKEWGIPVHDDRKLFEMLILECFQAGLSWECVLNKQEAFYQAFDGFDLDKVCAYGEEKLDALQNNTDIIRNRLKIRAAVNNAKVFRSIQQEYGSFSRYLWHWTDDKVIYELDKVSTPLSDAVSKDLKKRGMKFVGTTIVYSYMQAVGVIYSHEPGCFLEHGTGIERMEENKMEHIRARLADSEKILIGIGREWRFDGSANVMDAYESLNQLIKGKDYFIVTTNTDGTIYDSSLDKDRITAPCGNVRWRQCSGACTKDIWEQGEVPEDICPHCGAPLTGNTVEAETYIEEGYLPQWNVYTKWLTTTLNRRLTVLELGEGFKTPTVIRWPFEKTVFFNRKSYMYRVNESFAQISEEIKERAEGISENSMEWIKGI